MYMYVLLTFFKNLYIVSGYPAVCAGEGDGPREE